MPKFEAPWTSISELVALDTRFSVHVAVPAFSVSFVFESGEEGSAAVLFGGYRPSAAAVVAVPLHLQRRMAIGRSRNTARRVSQTQELEHRLESGRACSA